MSKRKRGVVIPDAFKRSVSMLSNGKIAITVEGAKAKATFVVGVWCLISAVDEAKRLLRGRARELNGYVDRLNAEKP